MAHIANDKIRSFIRELESAAVDTAVCENIYDRKVNAVAADNLAKYLSFMGSVKPAILLVGEAPGVHGCARTGIPFTDEDSLINCLTPLSGLDFHVLTDGELEREQSAQIIWEVLSECDSLPLIWNMYPFHPHESGNHPTNRTPSSEEEEQGKIYLAKLMALFQGIQPIAIGRKSEKVLQKDGEVSYIRHPAHGGKVECQKKLRQVLAI